MCSEQLCCERFKKCNRALFNIYICFILNYLKYLTVSNQSTQNASSVVKFSRIFCLYGYGKEGIQYKYWNATLPSSPLFRSYFESIALFKSWQFGCIRLTGNHLLLPIQSSESMKSEFFLISKSCSRFVWVLSSFWWHSSACSNWNKDTDMNL